MSLSAVAVGQTTVIGGTVGNANFNASDLSNSTNSDRANYTDTPNWFFITGSADGSDESSQFFTFSTASNGSTDPAHPPVVAAMPFNNRFAANDVGHTVVAGDVGQVFKVSYDFGAGGGAANWDGDEVMQTFIFETIEDLGSQVPVDEILVRSETTILGQDDYEVDRANDGQWTIRNVENLYEITADDIGKTLYFGFQFVQGDGASLFPRIDAIVVTIDDAPIVDNVPTIVVDENPDFICPESPATTGTTTFVISNDAEVNNLEVSGIAVAGTGFSVTSPAGAFSVAPGAQETITVSWDSTAGGDYEEGTLTISSNDPDNATFDVVVAGGVPISTASDVLVNGDFETPGTSPGDDLDTFADWDEVDDDFAAAAEVMDVPGLLAGSTTAAFLQGVAGGITDNPNNPGGSAGSDMSADLPTQLSNFEVNCDFAISEGTAGQRLFSVILSSVDSEGVVSQRLNLRYQGGNWQARNGNEAGFTWDNVLSDAQMGGALAASTDVNGNGIFEAGDTRIVHKLKITGKGWGTPYPSTVLEIQDDIGATVATSEPFSLWRVGAPTGGNEKLAEIGFSAAFNNAPASWVDEVVINGSILDTEVVVPSDEIVITDCSFDPTTGAGSITFNSEDAVSYEVRASSDLDGDPFSANLVTSGPGTGASTTLTFTDASAVGQTKRFYRVERP